MGDVVLKPGLLRFSHPELERAFRRHRSETVLQSTELNFLKLNGVLYFLFVVPEFISSNFTFNLAFALKLLGALLNILHYFMAQRLPAETWLQNRFVLVTLFRTARLLVFLTSVPLWIDDAEMDAGTLFKATVLRTGLLVNVWYAIGMPLLFTEHLPLHGMHVAITALVTTNGTCGAVLETPASREMFREVWMKVNQLLLTLAGVSDLPCKRSADVEETLMFSCQGLLYISHLLIGFALPTLLLWKMEVASRQDFVRTMNQRRDMGRIRLDCSWIPDLSRIVGECYLWCGMWSG